MENQKRVIALGFFDGIHIGHAALMRRTVARAGEMGAIPTVMSFDVHPDTLVRGTEVPLINSAHGREELIRRLFRRSISRMRSYTSLTQWISVCLRISRITSSC